MGVRITGFTTPFGGITFEYTPNEKENIKKLFLFLEARRILTNPIEMETKELCRKSASEIREKLTDLSSEYTFSEKPQMCFRSMIGACNDFLTRLEKATDVFYQNSEGSDWDDISFSKTMKEFRDIFRDNINTLSSLYNIPFNIEIPKQF